MPMHDWTRVEAGVYHSFHTSWLVSISRALNTGILPPEYYAMSEQVTATIAPDIVTLQQPGEQPIAPPLDPRLREMAIAPLGVKVIERGRRKPLVRARRRLAIRHVSGHRVVAVIELVSPGNKESKKAFRAFVEKAVAVLTVGVHLHVIDPFPPGPRDPGGLHPAIWHAITRPSKSNVPLTVTPDQPLAVMSYQSDDEVLAAVQPFAVGEPVPTMPLFLEVDYHVNVPLEDTYQAAFAELASFWRKVLETTPNQQT